MKTLRNFLRPVALIVALTGLISLGSVHVFSSNDGKAPANRNDLAKVKESYSRIPLSFEPNYGQAGEQVKFTSRGSGYSLALAPTSFTLAVTEPGAVVRAILLGGERCSEGKRG